MESDAYMTTWRPMKIGDRVRVSSRCKAYTGWHGDIIEVMEQRIDGLSRYGVRLDNHPERTTDFRRYELCDGRAKRKTAQPTKEPA